MIVIWEEEEALYNIKHPDYSIKQFLHIFLHIHEFHEIKLNVMKYVLNLFHEIV